MSTNPINDISKVYLEQVVESAVPGKPAERLGAVTAIPKSEQEAARERLLAKAKAKREKMKEENEIDEAVKGTDPEMRRAASAERRSGDKKLAPSTGKGYADQQKQSIAYMDKVTKKNKNVVGLVTKEELDIFDIVLEFLCAEGYAETLEEAEWLMANELDSEDIAAILESEQLQELSNRKLSAYVKKSEKSHKDLNKKWDQGTATYMDKYKSINRERGQERALKTLDKRTGK